MRDHTKLRAFQLSDELLLLVYKHTANFPKHELFGLTNQIRRSAISIPSNIVEGCARYSKTDYVHFLNIAYASARELEYQLSVSFRLGYLKKDMYQEVKQRCVETSKVLSGLIRSLRK